MRSVMGVHTCTISFTIASKIPRKKYNQEGKRPILLKLETLMKEIEEDTDKWKRILRTWMGRINIMKMSILHKINLWIQCNAQ